MELDRGPRAEPHGPPPVHGSEEWAEVLARTVAHLAAQLTMAQLRVRALATVLEERGLVDDARVGACLKQLAVTETGIYLHENLGPALAELIDVDALQSEIVAYLGSDS
jgi:hypothetical protein